MMSGVAGAALTVAAASFDSRAQAECILQPNQQAPEGTHWSLHYDPAKNRRCWILVDATGHDISTYEVQPAASGGLSSLQSFLANITGSAPPAQEVPASPAAPPPRKPQPQAVNPNRADRTVRTEPKSEAHPARHEMTQGERDALFEEFLRWRESQKITGPANPQPSR